MFVSHNAREMRGKEHPSEMGDLENIGLALCRVGSGKKTRVESQGRYGGPHSQMSGRCAVDHVLIREGPTSLSQEFVFIVRTVCHMVCSRSAERSGMHFTVTSLRRPNLETAHRIHLDKNIWGFITWL